MFADCRKCVLKCLHHRLYVVWLIIKNWQANSCSTSLWILDAQTHGHTRTLAPSLRRPPLLLLRLSQLSPSTVSISAFIPDSLSLDEVISCLADSQCSPLNEGEGGGRQRCKVLHSEKGCLLAQIWDFSAAALLNHGGTEHAILGCQQHVWSHRAYSASHTHKYSNTHI